MFKFIFITSSRGTYNLCTTFVFVLKSVVHLGWSENLVISAIGIVCNNEVAIFFFFFFLLPLIYPINKPIRMFK